VAARSRVSYEVRVRVIFREFLGKSREPDATTG
jgi:hypothetical protein